MKRDTDKILVPKIFQIFQILYLRVFQIQPNRYIHIITQNNESQIWK